MKITSSADATRHTISLEHHCSNTAATWLLSAAAALGLAFCPMTRAQTTGDQEYAPRAERENWRDETGYFQDDRETRPQSSIDQIRQELRQAGLSQQQIRELERLDFPSQRVRQLVEEAVMDQGASSQMAWRRAEELARRTDELKQTRAERGGGETRRREDQGWRSEQRREEESFVSRDRRLAREDRRFDDQDRQDPGQRRNNFRVGLITNLQPLLHHDNPHQLRRSRVDLGNVQVQRVLNSRWIMIGNVRAEQVLVRLPFIDADIQIGDRINLSGIVERMPGPGARLGLNDQQLELAEQREIFIEATRLRVLRD